MTFKTEEDSINYICNYFTSRGWVATPTQNLNQYEHYDITLTRGYNTIWVECKRRNFPKFLYNDAICAAHKYNYFKQAKENNKVDGVILVTLFTDCWCMSNALTPVAIIDRKGAHTTEFGDNRLITNHFAQYNLDRTLNYEVPQQED